MKNNYLTIVIAVFMLICSIRIQAQSTIGIQPPTPPSTLNQVELMKHFTGIWKCESKDTTFIIEDKYYGDGHEVYIKTETKGKIIWEGKALIGYDKKNDILVESLLAHDNPNIILGAIRFTSPNKFEETLLQDISNPENATLKWIYELKSPDSFIETYFQNNKKVSVHNYKRVKL